MALVVVDEIKYIIDQLRTSGSTTVTSGVPADSVPCNVVWDCDACLKLSDLADGVHTWYNKEPYYYYGNRNEVRNLLAASDKKIPKVAKYPCIILEQPFTEVLEYGRTKVSVRLLLATRTEKQLTYSQRYEDNFKTVLYPLYDDLITAFKGAGNVLTHEIKSKTDIPFYTEEEVVSNDYWDVIDVRLELNLIENCKNNELCQQ